MYPRAHARQIEVLPCLSLPRVEEDDTVKTAQVEAFMEKRRYLIRQPLRRAPVVVVPVHDDLTAGLVAGQISLRAYALGPRYTGVVNPRVFRHQIIDWIDTIVDHDQLARRIVLPQETLNRGGQKQAPICGRHDAGNQYCVG